MTRIYIYGSQYMAVSGKIGNKCVAVKALETDNERRNQSTTTHNITLQHNTGITMEDLN